MRRMQQRSRGFEGGFRSLLCCGVIRKRRSFLVERHERRGRRSSYRVGLDEPLLDRPEAVVGPVLDLGSGGRKVSSHCDREALARQPNNSAEAADSSLEQLLRSGKIRLESAAARTAAGPELEPCVPDRVRQKHQQQQQSRCSRSACKHLE